MKYSHTLSYFHGPDGSTGQYIRCRVLPPLVSMHLSPYANWPSSFSLNSCAHIADIHEANWLLDTGSISVALVCNWHKQTSFKHIMVVFFLKVWPGLGRPGAALFKSFFYCFRNESFAFFNRSGKASVDPIQSFPGQKYVKSVQREKVTDVTPCQPIKHIVYTSVSHQIM